MAKCDGSAPKSVAQGKSELPAHVVEQAEFIFRRGLWAVALCGPVPGSPTGCTAPAHFEKHKPTSGGKSPIVFGWGDSPIKTLDDVPLDAGNLGIYCGPHVAVVDLDGRDAIAWADSLPFLASPWITRTGSGDGQHRYFKSDGRKGMDLRPPKVANKVTVCSFGRQCVAPGAFHSTGRRYEALGHWLGTADDLPLLPREELAVFRSGASQFARRGALTGDSGGSSSGAGCGAHGSPASQPRHSELEAWRLWLDAHKHMVPGQGSYSLRRHRFACYLRAIGPCHPNKRPWGANVEALHVARFGGAALLLRQADVVQLMLESDWNQKAHDGDENRVGKPYPWTRAELLRKYIEALITCRPDGFGSQVCFKPVLP